MNKTKSKRTNVTNRTHSRLLRLSESRQIKRLRRQFLAALIVHALVFAPLLSFGASMPKAFAHPQFSNGSDRIFQGNPLNDSALEEDLTNRAIDDVIAFYNLLPTDRGRVMSHARGEVRSFLYPKLLDLIKKESPTAQQQAGLNAFAAGIKARRVLAAQKALEEYNNWTQLACVPYVPPKPYTYNPGSGCYPLTVYFTKGPTPPSFEEFQQFGAAIAYGKLFTPEAQDVTSQTTKGLLVGVGAGAALIGGLAGAALIGGLAGAAIGATITFGTLSAVLPFAGLTFPGGVGVLPAASTASGAVGSTAVAGPAGDGIEATRQITNSFPGAKIVIVTNYDDDYLREAANHAGACGYFLKDNLPALGEFFSVQPQA